MKIKSYRTAGGVKAKAIQYKGDLTSKHSKEVISFVGPDAYLQHKNQLMKEEDRLLFIHSHRGLAQVLENDYIVRFKGISDIYIFENKLFNKLFKEIK